MSRSGLSLLLPDASGGLSWIASTNGEAEIGGTQIRETTGLNLWVIRFDSDGEVVSRKPVPVDGAGATAACLTGTNDLLVLGGTLSKEGDAGVFLSKRHLDGPWAWTRRFPSSHATTPILQVGDRGEIFVAGNISRFVDFGGGELREPTAKADAVPQLGQAYVAGLDADGGHRFSRLLGYALPLAATTSGNRLILAARTFEPSLDLGSGHVVKKGNFALAMDPGGKVLWTRKIPGDVAGAGTDAAGTVRLLVYAPDFTTRVQGSKAFESVSLLTLGADGAIKRRDVIFRDGHFVAKRASAPPAPWAPVAPVTRCVNPEDRRLIPVGPGHVAVTYGKVAPAPDPTALGQRYFTLFDETGQYLRTWHRFKEETDDVISTVGPDGSLFEIRWDTTTDDGLEAHGTISRFPRR
jgi:hypothetical protein